MRADRSDRPIHIRRDDAPVNIELSCIGIVACCAVSGLLYRFSGVDPSGYAWLLFLVLPLTFLFFVSRRELLGVMKFTAALYLVCGTGWFAYQNLNLGLDLTPGIGRVKEAFTTREEPVPGSPAAQAPPPGSFAPSTFSSNTGRPDTGTTTMGTGPMIRSQPSVPMTGQQRGGANAPVELPVELRQEYRGYR